MVLMSAMPKGASVEATLLMVSDICSPCPAAMLVPKLPAHIVRPVCASALVFVGDGCLCYYQGNPEIGDSIRVERVIQGWDPASVCWLPSLPIRQNISAKPGRLRGLTLSFLEVHHRRGGLCPPNRSPRLYRQYNSVLPDLHVSPFSAFLSFLIFTFGPGRCFLMNPCVIGVDISPTSPVSGDSTLSQIWPVWDCRAVTAAPPHYSDGVICFCTLIQFCPQTRAGHLLSIAAKWGLYGDVAARRVSQATCRCYYSRTAPRRTHKPTVTVTAPDSYSCLRCCLGLIKLGKSRSN